MTISSLVTTVEPRLKARQSRAFPEPSRRRGSFFRRAPQHGGPDSDDSEASAHGNEKKTEQVKIWTSEQLLLEHSRLAIQDDRKLSDYITRVLEKHVYGHRRPDAVGGEGANRTE